MSPSHHLRGSLPLVLLVWRLLCWLLGLWPRLLRLLLRVGVLLAKDLAHGPPPLALGAQLLAALTVAPARGPGPPFLDLGAAFVALLLPRLLRGFPCGRHLRCRCLCAGEDSSFGGCVEIRLRSLTQT